MSESVGYLAAALTTCSFVPQVWHTLRTRDVRGISLGMYSVLPAASPRGWATGFCWAPGRS